MTRRELTERLKATVEPLCGEREAGAIARLVAEKRYGLSRAELALEPLAKVDEGNDFERILADLAAARPVQYILGTVDFDGLELDVGEGVLIPRPETEELVRWITADHELRLTNSAPKILDIGTGSGAIAIALAKHLPEAQITAIDISSPALKYARINNEKYSAGITVLEGDILDPTFEVDNPELSTGYDIIVSNPPYIPASERVMMAPNVTEYEPAEALFVPDADPLVFYRTIAKFARSALASQGALYFEIHESAGESIVRLLETEGFGKIELRRDINSKPRMIKCRL